MDSTQVENTTTAPVMEKKRIVKKKIIRVKKEENTSETKEVAAPVIEKSVTTDTEENEEKDNGSIIPSSRIKNYINKEKLNKELDTLIEKIKSSDSNLNLNTILSEEYQKKIGAVIKEKEEFNVKNPDAKVEINLNAIAIDVLSKHRFKFSNNSFKVLSVFSDMIVEEITKYAMDELVKNKKSIINNKYVFNSDIENGSLYNVYSKLPSFIAMKKEMFTVQAEVVESELTEVSESEQTEKSNTKNINFEFYIRKICNKLKGTKEEYSKIKVSDKYQKLCSNIILDLLDQVAPLSKIILDVMSTKTITELVFQTIVKIQLWNGKDYDNVLDELNKRLEKK
jgi:hypothetical protein